MKKRLVSLLLMVFICSFTVIPVAAANISAYWLNTRQIALTLTFSGGKANASGIIYGENNVSQISATYSLQEKTGNTWSNVYTWSTVSVSGKTLTFSGSTNAEAGKTYRLYVIAIVTNTAGVSETVTEYLEKVY